MKPGGFFSFGNMSIDDLVFADGTTRWRVPGGNAVYAALGMAVWGVYPSVVSRYGPDYPVDAVGPDRLNFSSSKTVPQSIRSWGLYEDDGTRQFTFRRATSDWEAFSPDASDLGPGPYRHCHVAPLPWRHQVRLVSALRARGAEFISLDIDDRRIAGVPWPAICQLIAQLDHFLPSRQDVEAMLPGLSDIDALRHIRESNPETAVIAVKRGSEGVIIHAAGAADYVSIPTIAAQVVDTTGAGDAFCGGFLIGYVESGDAIEAAARGSVSASFAVAGLGASALLTAHREEAEARAVTLRERIETHCI